MQLKVISVRGTQSFSENSVFDNKVLLITGDTGSFGDAVLCKFLKTGLSKAKRGHACPAYGR